MDIFIYMVTVISDNRFWLMPLVLFCAVVLLVKEIRGAIRDM